jgi:hypothetical protein
MDDKTAPAFPVESPAPNYFGMSQRQYFAGQALIGLTSLMSQTDIVEMIRQGPGAHGYRNIAEMAACYADAMVERMKR